jgi:hypothetical protein
MLNKKYKISTDPSLSLAFGIFGHFITCVTTLRSNLILFPTVPPDLLSALKDASFRLGGLFPVLICILIHAEVFFVVPVHVEVFILRDARVHIEILLEST